MTMTLLPPAADKCQVCARSHAADMPHDPTTLYAQTRYVMEVGDNNAIYTWNMAMAHCDERTKQNLRHFLVVKGIDLDGSPFPKKDKG